jgi:ethanolamine utilization protein EutN
MKLGKVIGRVVCTQKLEYFDGLKLLLVQPLDEYQQEKGDPLVAVDTVQAGENDVIFYETSKEAAGALPEWFTPVAAAIIGIIDHLDAKGATS